MKNTVAVICAVMLMTSAAWSQAGLGDIVKRGVEGPIVVVDLVKFKPGQSKFYEIYDRAAQIEVERLGGDVIFRGNRFEVNERLADSFKWDRVTFRKYPSAKAVMAMAASKGYQKAFPNRLKSVEDSMVYAFSSELPKITPNAKAGRSFLGVLPEPESEDSVYMLNLLRFKPDGGRQMYFTKYGPKVSPMISKLGGGMKYALKGEAAVIGTEVVDRLILVHYPDPKGFEGMIASDAYKAVSHFRTDAIELGLLFPFTIIPPYNMKPHIDPNNGRPERTLKLQTDFQKIPE